MDPIKEAFIRVKEEIFFLKEEIKKLNSKISFLEENFIKIRLQQNNNLETAHINIPTDVPTHFTSNPQEIKGLKDEKIAFSTGNKGVTTDKPTDRQTNQQTDKKDIFFKKEDNFSDFERIKNLLNSLDSVKKEIRLKFKRLTNREMQIFSTIYSLEEQGFTQISYKLLADHFNLTESSIRDYTNKIIEKGIPIIKIRPDNKIVYLKISDDLKKVVSLQTIISLRDL